MKIFFLLFFIIPIISSHNLLGPRKLQNEIESKRLPFKMRPSGKDYIWGGERLKTEFHKDIDMTPLSETWECSTHPHGPSFVAQGKDNGKTLKEFLAEHPDYLGTKWYNENGDLPILIKFIDAKRSLSVQVHPNDKYANEKENGQSGKTEFWYVLDTKEDSYIVYGLKKGVTKEKLMSSLEDSTIENYLNKVKTHKHDTFFIPSGTVHSIGPGILIAEIQQSSDITYRLYDYNRIGKDGKKRPLHIKKSMDVINFEGHPHVPKIQLNEPDATNLVSCPIFTIDDLHLKSSTKSKETKSTASSFMVYLCYNGSGTILDKDGKTVLNFNKGDCIFVPADSEEFFIKGEADLLRVHC